MWQVYLRFTYSPTDSFPVILSAMSNMKQKRERRERIGSHNYGGWEVPRPSVGKLETQESWQCELQFEDRRRPMSQFKQAGRQSSLLLKRFVFFFTCYMQVFSFCRLTGWGLLTLGRDNLLYSNINIIQKHPHKYTQHNIWQYHIIYIILWSNQADTENEPSHRGLTGYIQWKYG